MKNILSLLAPKRLHTFKVMHSAEHKSLFVHHVANDPSHPLCQSQRRRLLDRSRRGLWWHATTGTELSKSSCVRTWARRRLRNAMRDELKRRGYDTMGMSVDAKPLLHGIQVLRPSLAQDRTFHLSGSLRLQALPPLLSARYQDVCAEAGQVIDAMLEVIGRKTIGQGPARNSSPRSSPSTSPTRNRNAAR